MNPQIFVHVLFALDLAGAYIFLRTVPLKSRIVLGILALLGTLTLFCYARLLFAIYVNNPTGWDDLIYAVLFSYGSYALLFAYLLIGLIVALRAKRR